MTRSKVMLPVVAVPYGKGLPEHEIVGASYQLLIKDDCPGVGKCSDPGCPAHYSTPDISAPNKITKNTRVTMPVCPSDWSSNDFAPFGPETYRRAANQRKYIRDKFRRNCWFTRKDGAFYITFNVYHVAHKEIEWFKKCFFLDDQPHTFHDVGV